MLANMASVSESDAVFIPNEMVSQQFLLSYFHMGYHVTKLVSVILTVLNMNNAVTERFSKLFNAQASLT